MNKYEKALDTLENEYDAFYFENKYGEGTHPEEFKLLYELQGSLVTNALGWIRCCYDCYYKHEVMAADSAFGYLKKLAREQGEDE